MGGIPISVDPSFFVIIAVLGYRPGVTVAGIAIWVGVAFVAVLVHELGHAVAFRSFGRRPKVLLYGFGGLTSAGGGPMSPARSFVVAVAGPFIGFALGVAVWLAFRGSPEVHGYGSLWREAYLDALFVTFGFGILNLMPVLPLDGGNAMASVLRRLKGEDGDRTAHQVSVGVCAAGGFVGLATQQYYLAFLALIFGGQSWAHLRREKEEPLFDLLRSGSNSLMEGDVARARAIAAEVLAARPSATLVDRACVLEAWGALADGDPAAAQAALDGRPDSPPGNPAKGNRDPMLEGLVGLALGGGDAALQRTIVGLTTEDWVPANVVAGQLSRPGTVADLLRILEREPISSKTAIVGIDRLQLVTHMAGAYSVSAEVGQRRFMRSPDGVVAFNVACSLTKLGRLDEAMRWLQQAIAEGWHDLAVLDADPDLEALRALPDYAPFRATL